MKSKCELRELLSNAGLTASHELIIPLDGGVSGEVFLARTAEHQFVVKRAFDRLRVEEKWLCDARRNLNEFRAINFIGDRFPGIVPKVLHVDPEQHLFVMEYFGDAFMPWKRQLLSGVIDESTVQNVAQTQSFAGIDNSWPRNGITRQNGDSRRVGRGCAKLLWT